MKNKQGIFIMAILLTVMLVFLFYSNTFRDNTTSLPPSTQQGNSTSASTTKTNTQKTTATASPAPTSIPTPEPTPEPTPDTAAQIRELTAALQAQKVPFPIPITEDYLNWLYTMYGQEVLTALQAATPFTAETWYALTGNSMFVLADLYTGAAQTADNIHLISTGTPNQENKVTTMTFGGDICFADNYVVMQHLKTTENGITDCIDQKLIDQMQQADIAFLNNEFTISDRGKPLAGKAYTFRAAPEHTALYHTLGVDIVSLANNHAYDYGEDAFLDTLDTLDAYNIARIGAGRNLEEAQKPVYYLVNGKKIAFVAATRAEKYILTPAATKTESGVLRCYDTKLFLETIKEAKANSDYVIACIHWGKEGSNSLETVQQKTAYEYIDAGADLIIGAHAHRLQGIEYYKGKAIFYNLGNFWFDNYNIETGLVKMELFADGTSQFTFLPAWEKDCVTTFELGTEKGNTILKHVESYSINVDIDENGVITPT